MTLGDVFHSYEVNPPFSNLFWHSTHVQGRSAGAGCSSTAIGGSAEWSNDTIVRMSVSVGQSSSWWQGLVFRHELDVEVYHRRFTELHQEMRRWGLSNPPGMVVIGGSKSHTPHTGSFEPPSWHSRLQDLCGSDVSNQSSGHLCGVCGRAHRAEAEQPQTATRIEV
jgi:hypothetical protein